MIDYSKIKYTRDWFDNPENQAHTIQDVRLFKTAGTENANVIQIGEHFLLDLIPVFSNGKNRASTDVEIWEVVNTKRKHFCKERNQWFEFEMLRKITSGKQFGFPNGYWKVKDKRRTNETKSS